MFSAFKKKCCLDPKPKLCPFREHAYDDDQELRLEQGARTWVADLLFFGSQRLRPLLVPTERGLFVAAGSFPKDFPTQYFWAVIEWYRSHDLFWVLKHVGNLSCAKWVNWWVLPVLLFFVFAWCSWVELYIFSRFHGSHRETLSLIVFGDVPLINVLLCLLYNASVLRSTKVSCLLFSALAIIPYIHI